jgi:hypothetical protein
MFDSSMKTEAIPERVFALCKKLENGSMADKDAKAYFEPASMAGSSPYYGAVKKAADQLGLIISNEDEKSISLNIDPEYLENMSALRRYINDNLNRISGGQFYQTTKTWMVNSEELFHVPKEAQSVSKMPERLNKLNQDLKLDENGLRAWRFWASFLGFGYLQGMFFLPNAAVFICDVIINSGLKPGTELTIGKFFDILYPKIDICIDKHELEEKKINLAMSNALRTLNDLGKVQLKFVNDRQDEWALTSMPLHQFGSFVTDIKIGENLL